jgi:2'-5' RNA ligase
MTLAFLGEISDGQLRCVEGTADAIRGEPFTLRIDGIGYWYRPRILWAGPRETPESLSQLVLDLQNGLKTCGFEPERRRFKPHITLCRKAGRTQPRAFEPAIEWPVTEFVLAVSGGGAPGEPKYRVLKRWSLGVSRS